MMIVYNRNCFLYEKLMQKFCPIFVKSEAKAKKKKKTIGFSNSIEYQLIIYKAIRTSVEG